MSPPGGIGRTWQRLRGLPDRTPLRVKMITAVLVLVIIALLVISFTTRAVFSGYLYHQAQGRLRAYYAQVEDLVSSGNLARYDILNNNAQGEQVWILDPHGQPLQPGGPGGQFQQSVPPPHIPIKQSWLTANANKPVTVSGQAGTSWLVITNQIPNVQVIEQGQVTTETVVLVVGYDLGNISQDINYLTEIDLLVSGAVVIVLALVGVAVVRASLRPLTDIEQTAAAIAQGDLSRRVPDRDPRTEVGRLGRSLNAMLAQIESAFRDRTRSEEAARQSEQRMRQFVADASHELRTPLTAIRGFAEYYRQRGGVSASAAAPELPGPANGTEEATAAITAAPSPGSPEDASASQEVRGPLARSDLDRMMQRVEQESSRMGVLVEDMLLLARLDQQRPLEQRPLDLLTLAADAVGDARVVAPERSISLTVGISVAPIVLGDEVRLRQVIGNLMSNAISHTPDGTPIEVRVRSGRLDEWRSTPLVRSTVVPGRSPGSEHAPAPAVTTGRTALAVAGMSRPEPVPAAVLEVADHGPGLTPEQAEHVFERFYRADQARTWKSKGGGAGLGLAIVSALVAAHGGTVWVESPPGGGATFRIAIPLAPEARHSAPDADDETDPAADETHPALDETHPALDETHPALDETDPGHSEQRGDAAEPDIVDFGRPSGA